jgi:hypothetical protein
MLGTICKLVELALADIADNLDEVYAPRVYFFSPRSLHHSTACIDSIYLSVGLTHSLTHLLTHTSPQSLLPLHGSPPIPPHELQDQSL